MRRMISFVLLAIAAILLVLGYVNEQESLVWAALGVSCLCAVLVLLPRIVGLQTLAPVARRDAESAGEPDRDSGPDPHVATGGETVVFVPGKLTFHAAGCSEIADARTSAAARSELEAGEMKPCPHCLAPTA